MKNSTRNYLMVAFGILFFAVGTFAFTNYLNGDNKMVRGHGGYPFNTWEGVIDNIQNSSFTYSIEVQQPSGQNNTAYEIRGDGKMRFFANATYPQGVFCTDGAQTGADCCATYGYSTCRSVWYESLLGSMTYVACDNETTFSGQVFEAICYN